MEFIDKGFALVSRFGFLFKNSFLVTVIINHLYIYLSKTIFIIAVNL